MASLVPDIDETDNKILEELKKNSRSTFADIGRAVGLTGPAVRERIRKMEDMGVIMRYTTIINQHALGNTVHAIFLLRNKNDPYSDKYITEQFEKMPGVLRYWSVTGNIDFVVEVAAQSMNKLSELRLKFDHLGFPTLTYIVLTE
jgi:Lrp/AsnC family leucine-responsive transcriptional regulator